MQISLYANPQVWVFCQDKRAASSTTMRMSIASTLKKQFKLVSALTLFQLAGCGNGFDQVDDFAAHFRALDFRKCPDQLRAVRAG